MQNTLRKNNPYIPPMYDKDTKDMHKHFLFKNFNLESIHTQ